MQQAGSMSEAPAPQQPQQPQQPLPSSPSVPAAPVATTATAAHDNSSSSSSSINPAAPMAKMETEDRRSSSTSFSDREQPTARTIHKAVKAMREDVDDLMDAAPRTAQRQALYLLHSQVKRDRAETSCQLVVQGFDSSNHGANQLTQ